MTKKDILKLISETKTPQIRAGETHKFNDIWMVVADNRIFCRQSSFGRNSWYNAFQEDKNGAIKCGDSMFKIEGIIPSELETINSKVNEAYIEKYASRLNHYPEIAHKMTGEKYMQTTTELVLM